MKNILHIVFCIAAVQVSQAQTVVTIESEGDKYQVIDLTKTGTITWGGYEEIGVPTGDGSGQLNTLAITKSVGNNPNYDGRTYAAKECENVIAENFDDWYLPAKNEAKIIYLHADKFSFEERITLWTSTEASGTQAVSIYMYNGEYYNVQKVDSYHYVCMRKVK
jgi:hypothetical protein